MFVLFNALLGALFSHTTFASPAPSRSNSEISIHTSRSKGSESLELDSIGGTVEWDGCEDGGELRRC